MSPMSMDRYRGFYAVFMIAVWSGPAVAPAEDAFHFASMGQPARNRAAGPPAVPAKGHEFLREDFESEGAPGIWHGHLALDAGFGGGRSLRVERAEGQARASMLFADLPAEALRGSTVRGRARVRAEGVSAKPNPWNGIKCMLAIETPDRRLWPQAPIETGTFDWKQVGFTARIPADCTSARLFLGLEEVTGKAWFDEVKVELVRPPRAKRPAPSGKPIPKAHDLPRLRGAMVGPRIDEEGLRKLGLEWNANLVRWQLIRHAPPGQPAPLEDYDRWLDGELERLDAALVRCERYGLLVVVDLHSPPGGRSTVSGYVGSDDRLFSDRSVQDKLVDVWRRIAGRYKDAKAVWGYDLANEPVEEYVGEGCDDWHDLAERAARAVREIDARHAIIVEAPPWGSPESLADFEPLSVSGVVYSAHMYVPGAFTHQGVFRQTQQAYSYPGEIEGKRWDKTALEAVLRPVLEFQEAYSVPIYIGEFSAIRWAPDDSACRYLRDAIEIFESRGWDWSYHAFREWDGWSVEHGEDRMRAEPSPVPTSRERLLRGWFARNEKPSWYRKREAESRDGKDK